MPKLWSIFLWRFGTFFLNTYFSVFSWRFTTVVVGRSSSGKTPLNPGPCVQHSFLLTLQRSNLRDNEGQENLLKSTGLIQVLLANQLPLISGLFPRPLEIVARIPIYNWYHRYFDIRQVFKSFYSLIERQNILDRFRCAFVRFYGISTLVGCLMSNLIYAYVIC